MLFVRIRRGWPLGAGLLHFRSSWGRGTVKPLQPVSYQHAACGISGSCPCHGAALAARGQLHRSLRLCWEPELLESLGLAQQCIHLLVTVLLGQLFWQQICETTGLVCSHLSSLTCE